MLWLFSYCFSDCGLSFRYRAPEILLQSSIYDSAVGEWTVIVDQKQISFVLFGFFIVLMHDGFSLFLDMWAMGAIIAELLTLRPIFPGSRYFFLLHFLQIIWTENIYSAWWVLPFEFLEFINLSLHQTILCHHFPLVLKWSCV